MFCSRLEGLSVILPSTEFLQEELKRVPLVMTEHEDKIKDIIGEEGEYSAYKRSGKIPWANIDGNRWHRDNEDCRKGQIYDWHKDDQREHARREKRQIPQVKPEL